MPSRRQFDPDEVDPYEDHGSSVAARDFRSGEGRVTNPGRSCSRGHPRGSGARATVDKGLMGANAPTLLVRAFQRALASLAPGNTTAWW